MTSLLNIGTSALLANMSALQTTGNNIANAGVAGYSRQTAVMQTQTGNSTDSGYIGGGVSVSEIKRNYSEFLTRQVSQTGSLAAMDTSRLQYLQQLETVFPTGAASVGTALNKLLNGFSDIVTTPSDLSTKSIVVAQGNEYAARMRHSAGQLAELASGARQEVATSLSAINGLAQRIAEVNTQIARSQGAAQAPNELLDTRDQLVQQLSGYVKVSTLASDNGTLNVYVANQPLVLGTSKGELTLGTDTFGDSGRLQLSIAYGGSATTLDENNLTGGSVAGLLRFNNVDLVDARNALGRMAVGVTAAVNSQHRLGLTANGESGGDFFAARTLPAAQPAATNTGTAVLAAQVGDTSALKASDYEIDVLADGSFAIKRVSDGRISTAPAGATSLSFDGLRVGLSSGTPAAGDRFLLRPYAAGAAGMEMAIASGNDLATSSPVQAQAGTANAGSLGIQSIGATSSHAQQGDTVTLTFNANGTFDVAGVVPAATGVSYTAGQPISYNGWSLTLQGTPKAGDTVTVAPMPPGRVAGDAANASALMNLRDAPLFDGVSVADGYSDILSQVGVRVQGATSAAEVSAATARNATASKASLSGVNLDEEASRLLQYQQAYQASAKIIQMANTVFDTLIQNLGR